MVYHPTQEQGRTQRVQTGEVKLNLGPLLRSLRAGIPGLGTGLSTTDLKTDQQMVV